MGMELIMKICVIGLGYIGMPTAVMFASHGCNVVGVDVSEHVVQSLNIGKIVIEEPGLEELAKRCVEDGTLKASLLPEVADTFIIAVPTPNKDDEYKSCDLKYVLQAVRSILPYVRKGNTIIIESTIAPRTTNDEVMPVFEEAGFTIGKDLYLAHCPERVLPGKILYELENNNRIIGGITNECSKHAEEVYKVFVKGELLLTEAKVAELSKCMENTFRDVNISLANELAKICYELDINCLDVIALANKHPRVNIHQPGPGVGGHCLAIDPYFICAKAPQTAKMISLARSINKSMPDFVVDKVKMILKDQDEAKIAVFGVTYKGNIDDIRESPAIEIVTMLEEAYKVAVYDPHVNNPNYVSLLEAVTDADMILILADHNEFKNLDYKQIAKVMKQPILFDTKNMISTQEEYGLEIINYGNLYQHKNTR